MGYNCGCCYSGGSPGYVPGSSLEMAVAEYQPAVRMSEETHFAESAESFIRQKYGSAGKYTEGMYLQSRQQNYYFTPDSFLNDVQTEFISCKDEQQKQLVSSLVESAFTAVTGKEAPNDVIVRVCSEKEMKKAHRSWHPGIRGFSLNRNGFGVSEIFVLEDELARLMLTIGHEIGHVLTFPMQNPVDEEAKAFAFSLAWMDSVRENNIGGISSAIKPRPAVNGLHNAAFDFVAEKMSFGRSAFDVYSELINGEISINNQIPVF